MRRKDKKINDRDLLEKILQKGMVGHLALSDNGMPYCIPVNFAFHDNAIYFHSAAEGKKLEILKDNSRTSFQTEIFTDLVTGENPCGYSMKFASVNTSGRAQILESASEKQEALEIITRKYTGSMETNFTSEQVAAVACIRIAVETLTGKLSGYTQDELKKKLGEE